MLVVARCASLLLSPQRLGRVVTSHPRAAPSIAAFNPQSPRRREFIALGTTTVAMASTPPSALSAKKPVVLDAHLHVWPSPSTFTYAEGKAPPDALAEVSSAEALLEQFTKAGVDGCMIVQPINLGFDHTYVSSVIQKYPGKFVGCCLADPTEGGGGVDELARLLDSGYRAVRFNPGLWPKGEKMTNKIGRDMFKLCGERGVAVGFMCFHGLDLSIEEIETLCAEYPDTPVLMDHFGFAKGTKDPNWEKLLALSRFANVSVKASAQFRVVPEGGENAWPYTSTGAQLRQLVDALGAERVVWGSDFPFVLNECGYSGETSAAGIVRACGAGLSEEEIAAVMGGNLQRMFPGGWS